MPTPNNPRDPAGRIWTRPIFWVELFAIGNVAFLAVDIAVAHAVNSFDHPAEWVPVAFSPAAALVMLIALAVGGPIPGLPGGVADRRRRIARALGLAVGWACIAVGVAGLILHLESQFFEQRTLRSLVYTAPFAAPLAYAGLGLLLILNRMVDSHRREWGRWVALLAMGGFAGNFVLTLADHAQNGFFSPSEWIAVGSSAFATAGLLMVTISPTDLGLRRFVAWLMAVQVGVGMLGFVLHVRADFGGSASLMENFLYGAPAFAPLLFVDLAILGGLGLWAIETAQEGSGLIAGTLPDPTGS